MSSGFLPSAPPPPTYQESEEYHVDLPKAQGQFVQRSSYGSVHGMSQVPMNQGTMTVQQGTTYYTNYPPPQPVILQPTLVNNRTIIQPIYLEPMLSSKSCSVFCVACQKRIKTKTSSSYPLTAHLCCCLMFLSVGLLLCSPMAYCCCQPKRVVHTCPDCRIVIGTYYPAE